ncbi:MAG: DUF134 domain-containing protein [Candidatus Cloacimonetes bacterium]|nr:DUF134 domain-containing protein [Candidatus Cloacimonadota bacterium]
MPRPKKRRTVQHPPLFQSIKPRGIPVCGLPRIELTLDEYEAIRLADYEKREHLEASEMMNISRSTFTRLIETARHKVARMMIDGGELIIEGGEIDLAHNLLYCRKCGEKIIVKWDNNISECPECNSDDLYDCFGKPHRLNRAGHHTAGKQRRRHRGGRS